MEAKKKYLVCERRSVFALLTLSAGMMGAYTFNLRGGVFCNAQTANVVLMAIGLRQRGVGPGLLLPHPHHRLFGRGLFVGDPPLAGAAVRVPPLGHLPGGL